MLKGSTPKERVHFLHIRKTGGSAIKSVLRRFPETSKYIIEVHSHKTSLVDIPKGEKIIFCLRDPITRFVSGFYSRQRKGQPRYNIEWNSIEKEIFENFKTPNDLACALAEESSDPYTLALKAMDGIKHFGHYDSWYVDIEYFLSRIEDILYIGFTETLDVNFKYISIILALPQFASLPKDDYTRHSNPPDLDRFIHDLGIIALKNWYLEDYKFVSLCKQIMSNKSLTYTNTMTK